jgi:hypothetical protein
MLIDTSNPKQPDQKGRLISPQIYLTSNLSSCLIFNLHMHGDDVGVLQVMLKAGNEIFVAFSIEGNNRDEWETMFLEMQIGVNVRFQVLILLL